MYPNSLYDEYIAKRSNTTLYKRYMIFKSIDKGMSAYFTSRLSVFWLGPRVYCLVVFSGISAISRLGSRR